MNNSVYNNRNVFPIVVSLIFVVIAIIGIFWYKFYQNKDVQTFPIEMTEDKGDISLGKGTDSKQKDTIIDYNALKKDNSLLAAMEERKTDMGFDKGVDMIINPDETIKIGDKTIPMQDIIDKIRLKKGGVVEKNLALKSRTLVADLEKKLILDKMEAEQKRVVQLTESLNKPGAKRNKKKYSANLKQQQALIPIVSTYQKYKEIINEIETFYSRGGKKAGKDELERLTALKMRRDTLEMKMKKYVKPEENIETYGVFVVKPSDNIWNIHFNFLKDYFNHKGINLSPRADEPNSKGLSSGVGKILKFSENMVNIYNLKQNRLDTDLNTIQPFSKIVVFHLEHILSLLGQIDNKNVKYIHFDGETLWIPAEN